MQASLKKITGEVVISGDIPALIEKEVKTIADFQSKLNFFLKTSVTELLEFILSSAVSFAVSDVHIEPEKERAKMRFRIDGMLRDVAAFNQKEYLTILSRIKLLSGLKLNIADRPQDGRFSIILKKQAIEVRVSTLPAEYGEAVGGRILDPKGFVEMETLGLREDLLNLLNREIKRPHGMIIVTGRMGFGKTTTLYAILKKIKKAEVKIITIEDPIEYHLEGISQTQVAPEKGYDFASGLKSIVRQDPDAILVGEIRDLETANIALQAALTGHLVLATLHTNDAAGALARLQALGEKAVNIAPAINIAIAQRLVRRVCEQCVGTTEAGPEIIKIFSEELKKLPTGVLLPKIGSPLSVPTIKGCKACDFTGYKGRVGIFEAFLINDETEKFILTKPSISELKERAIKNGMVTMRQDGLIKVLEKITTIEEVDRVMGENE